MLPRSLLKLPTFAGEPGCKLSSFLVQFEMVAKLFNVPETAWPLLFFQNVTSVGKVWADTYMLKVDLATLTWKELTDELKAKFYSPDDRVNARVRLQSRTKMKTETTSEYCMEIQKLCAQVNPRMAEEEIVDHIIVGLPAEWQRELYRQGVTTVTECMKSIDLLESTEKLVQANVEKLKGMTIGEPDTMKPVNLTQSQHPFNCYICNRPGHIARNCQIRDDRRYRRSSSPHHDDSRSSRYGHRDRSSSPRNGYDNRYRRRHDYPSSPNRYEEDRHGYRRKGRSPSPDRSWRQHRRDDYYSRRYSEDERSPSPERRDRNRRKGTPHRRDDRQRERSPSPSRSRRNDENVLQAYEDIGMVEDPGRSQEDEEANILYMDVTEKEWRSICKQWNHPFKTDHNFNGSRRTVAVDARWILQQPQSDNQKATSIRKQKETTDTEKPTVTTENNGRKRKEAAVERRAMQGPISPGSADGEYSVCVGSSMECPTIAPQSTTTKRPHPKTTALHRPTEVAPVQPKIDETARLQPNKTASKGSRPTKTSHVVGSSVMRKRHRLRSRAQATPRTTRCKGPTPARSKGDTDTPARHPVQRCTQAAPGQPTNGMLNAIATFLQRFLQGLTVYLPDSGSCQSREVPR
jgi:hypothetical protein